MVQILVCLNPTPTPHTPHAQRRTCCCDITNGWFSELNELKEELSKQTKSMGALVSVLGSFLTGLREFCIYTGFKKKKNQIYDDSEQKDVIHSGAGKQLVLLF